MAREQLPYSDSMFNYTFFGNAMNADGYRMPVSVQYPTFTVDWLSRGVNVAGNIILSVDGDPGRNNIKRLGSGTRCWMVMGKPDYIDLDFTEIPTAARFRLIVR